MNFRTMLMCIMVCCIAISVSAQNEPALMIEQIIESVADDLGEDYDYTELVDRLNYYLQNPIDINKTNGAEFKEIMFINQLQINALLDRRNTNGAFLDLLELQSIEGIDPETARLLSFFVTIGETNPLTKITAGDIIRKAHHDLMLRYGQVLQKQLGFVITDSNSQSHFMGTPERLFVRYRYNYGQHVFASVNMEKDAGEGLFSGAQSNGFDFYSGNLFFKNIGRFKKIVLGDYALQFGQGLALWAGLGFGKGAAIAGITKSEVGLRPYSSANEFLFFRGVSATVRFNKVNVTPFVSYRALDGGLEQTAMAGEEVKSLNETGFHRTATEIANKNTVRQFIYGMNTQYSSRNLNVGFTAYRTSFDHPLASPQSEYNKFDFSGSSLINAGLYYNRTWKNIYFFGEGAHSLHGGFSYLNGALVSLSPQVSVVLLHRNYQKNFKSLYSRPVGEGSNGANEKGFYSGLTITPEKGFEWAAYADFFKFPWLKYRVDAPSEGFEVYSQLTYTIKNKLRALVRYKLEEKEQNGEAATTLNHLQTVQKQNYRAELIYYISKNIQLRNRVEITQYRKGAGISELGYLLYHDVIYLPVQASFSGNLRFAIFDTIGYDSRVYSYENDVLYSYSVPALQNSGIRFYINGRYRIARGIDVWAKYGITKYAGSEEIGSGPDLIQGNVKSDLKVQFRFQL